LNISKNENKPQLKGLSFYNLLSINTQKQLFSKSASLGHYPMRLLEILKLNKRTLLKTKKLPLKVAYCFVGIDYSEPLPKTTF